MSPEDALLYLADPDYAMELGVEAPKCTRCGAPIKVPPADWDGTTPLRHLLPIACEWAQEGVA